MKKLLFCLSVAMFAIGTMQTNAQNIIDAEESHNDNFYAKTLSKGKEAIPYQHLRENDVVWETCIWRTVDMREKFNQFFYFPTDPEKDVQGRQNLANTIIKALEAGQFEVYEDDELKIPRDWEAVSQLLNRTDSVYVPGELDEWGDETEGTWHKFETKLDAADIFAFKLKEFWYIEKQDTRQKVRIVALALVYQQCKEREDGRECNSIDMFWVPMNDMRVRNALVKVNAYDEHNIAAERSYDDIFIDRYFDSYITRESNRFNRKIESYLTGTDAIIESQEIETKLGDIESDMWEY